MKQSESSAVFRVFDEVFVDDLGKTYKLHEDPTINAQRETHREYDILELYSRQRYRHPRGASLYDTALKRQEWHAAVSMYARNRMGIRDTWDDQN